jgi:hypothetical protein
LAKLARGCFRMAIVSGKKKKMGKGKARWWLGVTLGIAGAGVGAGWQSALGLPPPQEPAEEILRGEIILEGRSPLDGQPLSASEYTLLREQLGTSPYPPQLNPQVRELIKLLRLRKIIRTLLPL